MIGLKAQITGEAIAYYAQDLSLTSQKKEKKIHNAFGGAN